MNNYSLNNVKNKIYEAEGLLELLQLRPDKFSELAPMILSRLDECRSQFSDLMAVAFKDNDEIHEDTPAPPPYADSTVATEDDIQEPKDSNMSQSESISQTSGTIKPSKASPVFCLNDRYRFRRSLFGGSDIEFNAAMDQLATLDSYEEAEDFFYGDRGLDADNEDVMDFMSIIAGYFSR